MGDQRDDEYNFYRKYDNVELDKLKLNEISDEIELSRKVLALDDNNNVIKVDRGTLGGKIGFDFTYNSSNIMNAEESEIRFNGPLEDASVISIYTITSDGENIKQFLESLPSTLNPDKGILYIHHADDNRKGMIIKIKSISPVQDDSLYKNFAIEIIQVIENGFEDGDKVRIFFSKSGNKGDTVVNNGSCWTSCPTNNSPEAGQFFVSTVGGLTQMLIHINDKYNNNCNEWINQINIGDRITVTRNINPASNSENLLVSIFDVLSQFTQVGNLSFFQATIACISEVCDTITGNDYHISHHKTNPGRLGNSGIWKIKQTTAANQVAYGDIMLCSGSDFTAANLFSDVNIIIISTRSKTTDMSQWLTSITQNSNIQIVKRGGAENFGIYKVDSISPIIVNSGILGEFIKIQVSHLAGTTAIIDNNDHDVCYQLSGPPGGKGDKGDDGNFGGITFDYTYISKGQSPIVSIMINGNVHFMIGDSSSGQKDSLTIQICKNDDYGNDLSNFMQTIISVNNSIKAHIHLSKKGDTTKYLMFSITDVNYNETSQSWFLTVQNISHSETNPFELQEDLLISFTLVGTRGDTGPQGPPGADGTGSSIEKKDIAYSTFQTPSFNFPQRLSVFVADSTQDGGISQTGWLPGCNGRQNAPGMILNRFVWLKAIVNLSDRGAAEDQEVLIPAYYYQGTDLPPPDDCACMFAEVLVEYLYNGDPVPLYENELTPEERMRIYFNVCNCANLNPNWPAPGYEILPSRLAYPDGVLIRTASIIFDSSSRVYITYANNTAYFNPTADLEAGTGKEYYVLFDIYQYDSRPRYIGEPDQIRITLRNIQCCNCSACADVDPTLPFPINENVTLGEYITPPNDTDPPVIQQLSDIERQTFSGDTSVIVIWAEPVITDNGGGTININKTHESGSLFSLGTTQVTYTATDAAGNSSTMSFNVVVLRGFDDPLDDGINDPDPIP